MTAFMSLSGELIVGGFSGDPSNIERVLARGDLGGVILFKRNIGEGPEAALRWIERRLSNAQGHRPIFAIDQEGGRVARFGAPLVKLPPARTLAQLAPLEGANGAPTGDAFLENAGFIQGREIAALGFSTSFAPVLDIHTHADNPIIGDRAFGTEPPSAARAALSFARGLERAGLFGCGKHYPGHGRTTADSHLELPVVDASEEDLMRTEFAPFAEAAKAGLPSFMTAHVLYPALDEIPATLSTKIATDILRKQLGFRGVLFSDDLEMKALSAPIEELAVGCIVAGCDALLICADEALQERARVALDREAERSPAFRARVEEARARVFALRTKFPPRPNLEAFRSFIVDDARRAFDEDLARRLAVLS